MTILERVVAASKQKQAEWLAQLDAFETRGFRCGAKTVAGDVDQTDWYIRQLRTWLAQEQDLMSQYSPIEDR